MKTLGQVLTSYREKKQLTIDHLAQKTSLPPTTIQALENDNFTDLPAAPLVRGYILLIATHVDLNEETALALYRRDVESISPKKDTSLRPRLKRTKWDISRHFFTPRSLSAAVLFLFLLIGGTVATWQWFILSKPPKLAITQPTAQAIVTSPLTVTGETSPEATVTINTQLVSVNQNGEFTFELPLPPGERALVVTAQDSRGRMSEQIIFVTVE